MPHADIPAAVRARQDDLVAIAQALIAVPSPNPPLSTEAVAAVAAELVRRHVPGAELSLHAAGEGVVNLVARLRGSAPGRRVVLSGHLDTYPVNDALPWSVDPLGGLVRDGRLYGRGAADMKGGIAASMLAMAVLADCRKEWQGEAVLALSGDEESMGPLGAEWLLQTVPETRGDAVIIGDAGSPAVVRFGEKGFLWVEVEAVGRPAHGAHVHLGVNAIDRLRGALDALSSVSDMAVAAPPAVTLAIEAARPVSEALSGAGEAHTLGRVTVNIGRIAGGTSMNLIPASAAAGVDIRLPAGMTASAVEMRIAGALAEREGVSWRVLRRTEPSFTSPESRSGPHGSGRGRRRVGPAACDQHARRRLRLRASSVARAFQPSFTDRRRSTWAAPTNMRWWTSWSLSRPCTPWRRSGFCRTAERPAGSLALNRPQNDSPPARPYTRPSLAADA